MTERERGSVDIGVLHRMITYVREEAIRLRVMEVALLLEHAQEAVEAFSPGMSGGVSRPEAARSEDRVEH